VKNQAVSVLVIFLASHSYAHAGRDEALSLLGDKLITGLSFGIIFFVLFFLWQWLKSK
jgi:hypothetical protein